MVVCGMGKEDKNETTTNEREDFHRKSVVTTFWTEKKAVDSSFTYYNIGRVFLQQ